MCRTATFALASVMTYAGLTVPWPDGSGLRWGDLDPVTVGQGVPSLCSNPRPPVLVERMPAARAVDLDRSCTPSRAHSGGQLPNRPPRPRKLRLYVTRALRKRRSSPSVRRAY